MEIKSPRKYKPVRVVNIYKEKCDKYIGRSKRGESKNIIGNPFSMQTGDSRDTVISKYAAYFLKEWKSNELFRKEILDCNGKSLGCFCHPKACHGDVIKAFLKDYFSKGEDLALKNVNLFIKNVFLKKGDLFTTKDYIIAHGCNCEGKMGAGVAKIIKDRFPEAFYKYESYCKYGNFTTGRILPVVSNGKIIVNLAIQEEYKHRWEDNSNKLAKIEHISNSLKEMVSRLELKYKETGDSKLLKISMPMVGCGLGGLSKEIVIPEIENIMLGSILTLTIYEL